MTIARLRNSSAAMCAVCFLLIGTLGAQQQKAAPQKTTLASKSEHRQDNEEKLALKNLPSKVRHGYAALLDKSGKHYKISMGLDGRLLPGSLSE